MMGGFGVLGLLVPILILVLAIWAITKIFPDWQDRVSMQGHEDSAEETLRQRFARGEIDAEEYEHSLEILRNGRAPENSASKST